MSRRPYATCDWLLDLARSVDETRVEAFRAERDYEGLEMYILEHLLGA